MYATTKTKARDRKGREMTKAAAQPSTNTLGRVLDLLVEHRTKLDALEHVLKETNPLVHELYLETIKDLQAQKTGEVNRVLSQTLKSRPTER
jgi:hypothetical protein